MSKTIHMYDITMSNGDTFEGVRIKGSLTSRVTGMGSEKFVSIKNAENETIEININQIVSAKLIDTEK